MKGSKVLVAIAIASIVVGVSEKAAAQNTGAPRVTLERGADRITVAAHDGTVTVKQALTPKTFDLSVAAGGDAVRLAGGLDGVTVSRGEARVRIDTGAANPSAYRAAAALLTGSEAVAAFDRMMRLPWVATRGAEVFVAAHGMLGVVRGQPPAAGLLTPAGARNTVRLMAAAQRTRQDPAGPGPADCWLAYERDVMWYTREYETCMRDAQDSWNLLAAGTCAYEYQARTTLAFFWLLSCSGFNY